MVCRRVVDGDGKVVGMVCGPTPRTSKPRTKAVAPAALDGVILVFEGCGHVRHIKVTKGAAAARFVSLLMRCVECQCDRQVAEAR